MKLWAWQTVFPVLSFHERGEAMKRTLMAVAAAATFAVSTLAAPAPAQAQRGVGAGVAAGLIGGAIVGGAIASQNGYYGGRVMVRAITAVGRPMSPTPAMAAPATCSVSGSGMVTAGG